MITQLNTYKALLAVAGLSFLSGWLLGHAGIVRAERQRDTAVALATVSEKTGARALEYAAKCTDILAVCASRIGMDDHYLATEEE